ncbi:MAG TPA: ribose-phosphate pyrophosphokinase [Kofleriaceae bacterium]|nr:ribose-phosphate pyrophosphokinase [Kofleriaceae bacterium]
MTPPIVFAVPGCEAWADRLCTRLDVPRGKAVVRQFPDGETYLRVEDDVAGRDVVLACGLDRPDQKTLPMLFLAETVRELGARRVGVVAPYLAYMRQDHRFHPGEGITSAYFGRLVSRAVDWLVTVDPHLHRRAGLDEIYSIPTTIVQSAPAMAAWIAGAIEAPVIIGPDQESAQWAAVVAERLGAPHMILTKIRFGDREVSISQPTLAPLVDRTPVIVDDIISTGRTMIETIKQLVKLGTPPPVCVGIHGVFADRAHDDLYAAGAGSVVTCNTIEHLSNKICLADAVAAAVRARLAA